MSYRCQLYYTILQTTSALLLNVLYKTILELTLVRIFPGLDSEHVHRVGSKERLLKSQLAAKCTI